MPANKSDEIAKVKAILNAVDPQIAKLALMQYEAEIEEKEAEKVCSQIKKFSKGAVMSAAAQLAPGMSMGLCYEGPDPVTCGGCILRMGFGGIDEIINPAAVRAKTAAMRMNMKSREM